MMENGQKASVKAENHWHCVILLVLGGVMTTMAAVMTLSAFAVESRYRFLSWVLAGYFLVPGLMSLIIRRREGCSRIAGFWGITCSTLSIWVVIFNLFMRMIQSGA